MLIVKNIFFMIHGQFFLNYYVNLWGCIKLMVFTYFTFSCHYLNSKWVKQTMLPNSPCTCKNIYKTFVGDHKILN